MILFVIFCLFVVVAVVALLVIPLPGLVVEQEHVVAKRDGTLRIRFSLLSKGFMRNSLDWHLAQYKVAFKHQGRMFFDERGDLWLESPTQDTFNAVYEFNSVNPGVIDAYLSYY